MHETIIVNNIINYFINTEKNTEIIIHTTKNHQIIECADLEEAEKIMNKIDHIICNRATAIKFENDNITGLGMIIKKTKQ